MKRVVIVASLFLLAACASVAEPTEPPAPTPRTALTAIAEQNSTEWHYVAFGDSTVFYPRGSGSPAAGMIYQYAHMLEEDLGVDIVLNSYASGSGGAEMLIDRVQSSDLVRDAVAAADVVTLQIPLHNLDPAMRLYRSDPEACGGEDNQDCLREAFGQYKRDTEAIFAEVTALSDPSEVLIRARDTYLFSVGELKESGDLEVLNRYWRDAQEHVHAVAEQHGIPVASVYDGFMGPDGTDDPAEKGWMMDDLIHPNEQGAQVMAQLMRELGYEYALSSD